ncbi:MAG: DEAD/DEAH box helicase [Bdellovibrionales bacterium]|nr:DEAD/DEAH box helicase [Bdellovibrionales bacterium]MBT7765575.1 DEAD/DEAH box helicase [Bdellovibrionales bacterium]
MHTVNQGGLLNASLIQDIAIEPILAGEDISIQAKTGSGKTAAFAIPIIEQLLRREDGDGDNCPTANAPLYVVLSPTRELAGQTNQVFKNFGDQLKLSTVCMVGGESIEKQKELVAKGVHIIVATPGRLKDLINQKVVKLDSCCGVVFDEADRLFDMGFKPDIEYILNHVPVERQLVMLSATTNMDVLRTAYRYKSHPMELKVGEDGLMVEHIDHQIAMISQKEKMSFLVHLLRQQENVYGLVFCNTQYMTHTVAEWLKKMNFKAQAISGRLPQGKRNSLMRDFRSREITILVSTDVAARGLDIEDIGLVINYDLPNEAANYVHRIGRTGRAGKSGLAVSFCAHEDCEYLDAIYDFIGAKIPKMDISDDDFATDLCRRPHIDQRTLKVSESTSQEHRPTRTRTKQRPPNHNKSDEDKPQRQRRAQGPKIEQHRQDVATKKLPGEQMTAKESDKPDRRFFEITSSNQQEADQLAMSALRITDPGLLGHTVLEEGRKKYLLFGPKEVSYQYFIRPIYKRLLTPFITQMLELAQLELTVRVSFSNPTLKVNFVGKDAELLRQNGGEMLRAFEYLIKTYVGRRVRPHRGIRYVVRSYTEELERDSRPRGEKSDSYLLKLIEKSSQQVLEQGAPVQLKPLNPKDRRFVHQQLSDGNSRFKTTSIGDGRFKRIEISMKE